MPARLHVGSVIPLFMTVASPWDLVGKTISIATRFHRRSRHASVYRAGSRQSGLRASVARAPESVGQNARVHATPPRRLGPQTAAFRDPSAVLIWQADLASVLHVPARRTIVLRTRRP